MDKDMIRVRSKEKLKGFLEREITGMFQKVLDFVEVSVEGKDRYRSLRSKVLRIGNNCIRTVSRELDQKYIVEFVAPGKDILVVGANPREPDLVKKR